MIPINNLLSNRLELNKIALTDYNYTLFGQIIKMQGWGAIDFDEQFGYFYIDSFYVNYTLQYGLIFMAVLLIVLSIVYKTLVKKKDNWIMLFELFTGLHGCIISSILLPYLSPFILFGIAEYTSSKGDKAELLRLTLQKEKS